MVLFLCEKEGCKSVYPDEEDSKQLKFNVMSIVIFSSWSRSQLLTAEISTGCFKVVEKIFLWTK